MNFDIKYGSRRILLRNNKTMYVFGITSGASQILNKDCFVFLLLMALKSAANPIFSVVFGVFTSKKRHFCGYFHA